MRSRQANVTRDRKGKKPKLKIPPSFLFLLSLLAFSLSLSLSRLSCPSQLCFPLTPKQKCPIRTQTWIGRMNTTLAFPLSLSILLRSISSYKSPTQTSFISAEFTTKYLAIYAYINYINF